MKKARKPLSLILIIVMILSIIVISPSTASAAVSSRNDGNWFFPLPQNYYKSFTDWAGCNASPGATGACPFHGRSCLIGCGAYHKLSNGMGHNGIDIGCPANTNVYASSNGTIVYAGALSARGNTIIMEHKIANTNYSYYSIYQHLASFVKSSGSANAGDLIAKSGNSGGNYGYHLHFSIIRGESGLGTNCFKYDSYGSSAKWLTGNGEVGQIVTNPKPGNTNLSSVNQHAGSVTYVFSANQATFWGEPAGNNPEGTLDIVSSDKPGRIFIRGWAFDRDNLNAALSIHVYIGKQEPNLDPNCELHTIVANTERSDLDDMFHVGKNHGFCAYIDTSLTGDYNVYVYAINIGSGSNAIIGQKAVTIQTPYSPEGTLDIVTANVPGKVFVRGWAFDRDDLEQSISIHVYIGQQEPNKDSNCEFHAIKADSERTDLDDMFHVGKNHGFSSYIDTQKTGSQNVYVYAINIGGGGNAFIGSRSVTITPATETQSTQITESATEKPTNPTVTETVTTTPTVPTTSPITTNPTQTKPTVTSPITTKPTESKTTVSLAKYSANIYVKGTTTIKPTVKNGKGVTTYKSNNTRVAKVDSGGKLTALKAGTAKITITNNKVSKVFTVKVLNPKLNKTSVSISRGKSYTLKITGKIGTAKFYTSNKKIATVNSKGKIKVNKKAKKGKIVIIKVKTNGITLKCKVKVK